MEDVEMKIRLFILLHYETISKNPASACFVSMPTEYAGYPLQLYEGTSISKLQI
jgi:hypothetical protein